MIHQSLNGQWSFHALDGKEWLPAAVPGGVHTDLLALGSIPDPFVADNEKRVQWIAETDWEYRTTFAAAPDLIQAARQFLVCDGLDTLAEVSLNGSLLGKTDNAFRSWTWDLAGLLRPGGTQIALMNPGGIRADIAYLTYPHNITYGDFLTVQPFDNKLVTMNLTGANIYSLLEQQFPPTQSAPKVLLVSGITYKYNLTLPVGSRIIDLKLADGTPIANDATTYTVTMNEYLATGGDKFSTFLLGTNVTRIGVSDLDALIEYVQFRFGVPPANTPIDPTIYPIIEGRIIKQ